MLEGFVKKALKRALKRVRLENERRKKNSKYERMKVIDVFENSLI